MGKVFLPQFLYHGTTLNGFNLGLNNNSEYVNCTGDPVYLDEILEFPIRHSISLARIYETDPFLLIVKSEKVSGDIVPRELEGWYRTDFLNIDSFKSVLLPDSYELSIKKIKSLYPKLFI